VSHQKANAGSILCSGFDSDNKELIQKAYTGDSVIIGSQWLKVYLLPLDHPLTLEVIAKNGLSINQIKRLTASNALVDRGIRIVNSPEELISEMTKNKPSIGYLYESNQLVKNCKFN
jgi:hypothetical protein